MFLVLSIVLTFACWVTVWAVAYKLADPRAPLMHSKTVGWVAGIASLPFLLGIIWCINTAYGESPVLITVVVVGIGMSVASRAGERHGHKKKRGVHRITTL